MIKSFADRESERLFYGRKQKAVGADLRERAVAKLGAINNATEIRELESPPGNRLEQLSGDRSGQYSIRINRQFRICFGFDGEAGDAFDVEITDYHG